MGFLALSFRKVNSNNAERLSEWRREQQPEALPYGQMKDISGKGI